MSEAMTLEGLAPVGLAELEETAALLSRVDRKYLLRRCQARLLVGMLPSGARVLEICGRREFGYASTYFDSADLDFFSQSAHGRRRRMKIRTRTYLDSGNCWLEVKTSRHGLTVKERLPRAAGTARLTAEDGCLISSNAHAIGIDMVPLDCLLPVLDTFYRRVTIHLPGNTRITIDTGLEWVSRTGPRRRELSDWLIVETKGGAHPSAFDRRLWSLGHRPIRISKYATGMACLHPKLRRNRWARVLKRIA